MPARQISPDLFLLWCPTNRSAEEVGVEVHQVVCDLKGNLLADKLVTQ